MQILGKVFKILPKDEGVSASGNFYCKQTIVISEAQGERKLAIEFFGDKKVEKLEDVKVGDLVQVSYYLDSRPIEKDEQERWFTSVSGASIQVFSLLKKSDKSDYGQEVQIPD